ncbi:unnamed protein product [Soboliphyme baturini]|uniref:Sorting nexin-27 n=1 Tax=Soboliphyme baturini TaxID=241478 RepID=A0A183IC48_9BILA|nr:unnamed protein product [Soboliphyme baturini]
MQMHLTIGFGFNVRGQISEGGQYRSINGQLYAPLQHVSAVLAGGAAEKAGLYQGDRILEVNGVSVEGATHKQVVDLIKAGGDKLVLTVISADPSELDRIESSVSDDNGSAYDYSEKRSLPITVPSLQWVKRQDEKFVVYNIYMAGRHLCSRRYSEFEQLNRYLKMEFMDFNFPRLPSKWPFALSEQQLDARRRGLEQYLEKVCSVRVLAESDIMQAFLMESQSDAISYFDVDIRILLPDQTTVTVTVQRNSNCSQVYKALRHRLSISDDIIHYFALFEMIEPDFDRKIKPNECPHSLYIQNYSSAAVTCIVFKRWLFCIDKEVELCRSHPFAHTMFYWMAVNDVNSGQIKAGEKLYELKALQDVSRKEQYLALARTLPGYGEITFPHCACDCYRNGHVVVALGYKCLRLQACTVNGTLESHSVKLKIISFEQCLPLVEQLLADADGSGGGGVGVCSALMDVIV